MEFINRLRANIARTVLMGLLAGMICLGLAACGGEAAPSGSGSSAATATQPAASTDGATAKEVKVALTEWKIEVGETQLPAGKIASPILIDRWTERRQDDAAALIASSYQGHIDSQINDQYRSPAGARRFLQNIIQYPGCGSFFQPASYVAVDTSSGKLCGMCLSSLVQSDVGHITQVCVTHAVRGTGVGYALVRSALESLAIHGCRKASLTVTAANTEAIGLYDRMSFRKTRDFSAYVWEGFS